MTEKYDDSYGFVDADERMPWDEFWCLVAVVIIVAIAAGTMLAVNL